METPEEREHLNELLSAFYLITNGANHGPYDPVLIQAALSISLCRWAVARGLEKETLLWLVGIDYDNAMKEPKEEGNVPKAN